MTIQPYLTVPVALSDDTLNNASARLRYASDSPETRLMYGLLRKLEKEKVDIAKHDRYFSGDQPLSFIAPEVRSQIGDRLTELVINWPRVIVNTVQRRVRLQGFRLGKEGQVDDDLWSVWTRSGMETWAPLVQVDSLVHKIAFLSVWTDEETGEARIYPESAHEMVVDYEPGSPKVRAALKRYDEDGTAVAILHLPYVSIEYRREGPLTPAGADAAWVAVKVTPNPTGVVLVVPLPNNPRLLNLDGESELRDVEPIADAVNKLATDLMVTSEFHAAPRRWATNLNLPNVDDPEALERIRETARQYWDALATGRTWLGGEGQEFGQFPEANLQGFVSGINLLTGMIAAVAGLPPHYLGVNSGDNPASADAIRSAESTLVERAKEKHRTWGPAYCRAVIMASAVDQGETFTAAWKRLRNLEADFVNPETSSKGADADYVSKLLPLEVLDIEAAQERVGLGPNERKAIAARKAAGLASAATADVEARMQQARALMETYGLTLEAAMATVGLLAGATIQNGATGAPTATGASAPRLGPGQSV